jgi:hypothetical protein
MKLDEPFPAAPIHPQDISKLSFQELGAFVEEGKSVSKKGTSVGGSSFFRKILFLNICADIP